LIDDALEVGTLLTVELTGANGQITHTILACIVHANAQAESRWAVGCNFIRELTETELKGLL
jgi:hypothetical protein